MSDKREWQEFLTGDKRSFLSVGDEIVLRDTPDMKKWRGKKGMVVRVNPKTITLDIEGDDRGLRVQPSYIAKFRPGDAASFRKAFHANVPEDTEDTSSVVCPGAKALRSECAVGDVVLMNRGIGLFNIIRITRFEAAKVAGVIIGGASSMIGKTRLFRSAWYVQKMDQARFPKQD